MSQAPRSAKTRALTLAQAAEELGGMGLDKELHGAFGALLSGHLFDENHKSKYGAASHFLMVCPIYVFNNPLLKSAIPTACADCAAVYINADFARHILQLEKLTPKDVAEGAFSPGLMATLAHEAEHIVMEHAKENRLPGSTREEANIAFDYGINTRMQKHHPDLRWPKEIEGHLLGFAPGDVAAYSSKSDSRIARILASQPKPKPSSSGQKGSSSSAAGSDGKAQSAPSQGQKPQPNPSAEQKAQQGQDSAQGANPSSGDKPEQSQSKPSGENKGSENKDQPSQSGKKPEQQSGKSQEQSSAQDAPSQSNPDKDSADKPPSAPDGNEQTPGASQSGGNKNPSAEAPKSEQTPSTTSSASEAPSADGEEKTPKPSGPPKPAEHNGREGFDTPPMTQEEMLEALRKSGVDSKTLERMGFGSSAQSKPDAKDSSAEKKESEKAPEKQDAPDQARANSPMSAPEKSPEQKALEDSLRKRLQEAQKRAADALADHAMEKDSKEIGDKLNGEGLNLTEEMAKMAEERAKESEENSAIMNDPSRSMKEQQAIRDALGGTGSGFRERLAEIRDKRCPVIWKLPSAEASFYPNGKTRAYSEEILHDNSFVDPKTFGGARDYKGLMLPMRQEPFVIVVLVDTSGSIQAPDLSFYSSALLGLVRQAKQSQKPIEVLVYSADDSLKSNPQRLSEKDLVQMGKGMRFCGGGGTNLGACLKSLEDTPELIGKKVSSVLYFTDCEWGSGEGGPPSRSKLPGNLTKAHFISLDRGQKTYFDAFARSDCMELAVAPADFARRPVIDLSRSKPCLVSVPKARRSPAASKLSI